MFDDKPTAAAPGNLPVEPADMFAGLDESEEGALGSSNLPPDALQAGRLKPKSASPVNRPESQLRANAPEPNPAVLSMAKSPITGKVIVVILIIAFLGVAGWGGWWVYRRSKQPAPAPAQLVAPPDDKAPLASPEPAPTESEGAVIVPTGTKAAGEIVNEQILFGSPVDSDKDGLDDKHEKELGADSNNPDTDGDGITDGDEVLIWKTDPLNPDTDGDTHLDGTEVYYGYNPLGTGSLSNIPPGATSTLVKPRVKK